MDAKTLKRFLAKVNKSGPDGCWLWTACSGSHGYGLMWNGFKLILAHRLSYEHFIGPIPAGLYVCHTCDIKLCINPAHLWTGTQAENLADMDRKGRRIPTTIKGEQHGQAKLAEQEVKEIRELADTVSQRKIAKIYNVGRSTIAHVIRRESWKHVH